MKTEIGSRKSEILKGAMKLFLKHGYIKTGMRDISKASRITAGTLYYYYKSKEDILADFLDGQISRNRETLEKMPCLFEQSDPSEALQQALQVLFATGDEYIDVVSFLYQENKNLSSKMRKKLTDSEDMLIQIFETIIQNGCDKGVFRVPNARLAAHNIIIMSDMWALRRWFLGNTFTSEQYTKMQIEFIFQALRNGSFAK
jgi:AcrR family transcriptional regulator